MCNNNTAEGRNSGAHSLLSGPCLLAKMIHLNCFRELEELLCSRFVAESWNAEGNKRAEGILKHPKFRCMASLRISLDCTKLATSVQTHKMVQATTYCLSCSSDEVMYFKVYYWQLYQLQINRWANSKSDQGDLGLTCNCCNLENQRRPNRAHSKLMNTNLVSNDFYSFSDFKEIPYNSQITWNEMKKWPEDNQKYFRNSAH